MANMSVSMKLSLLDDASPQLRAFIEAVKSLEGVISSVNGKFAAFAEGTKAIGSGTDSASAGAGRLDASLQTLNATVSTVAEKMAAAAASFGTLSAEASAAASGVASASTRMKDAGTHVDAVRGKVDGLATSLKGMAELWAAFKVEKGLKESVDAASEFQAQKQLLLSMNLPGNQSQEVLQGAFDDAKALKFVSALDAIKARLAAIGGLVPPTQDVVNQTVRPAMQLANNLRYLGETGDMKDIIRNAYGVVEARGQTNDPQAIKRTFDILQRAYETTGGKVNMQDIEMYLRQLGQGSFNISDDGLLRAIAAIDQLKIAGGSGGANGASRLGTAQKMLTAYMLGKPMNKQGAAMLVESGIMDSDALVGSTTTTHTNMKQGGAKDAGLAAADIIAWVEKYAPNIIAYTRKHTDQFYKGKSLDDPEAIDAAIQQYLTSLGISVTAAQAMALGANPRSQARIEDQRKRAMESDTVSEFGNRISGTYKQNVFEFNKALEQLHITIGERLLPILTPLIHAFGEFVGMLASFAQNHPITTTLNAVALAFGGLVLAINGIKNVFGIVGTLSSILLKMGGDARTGAAGVTAGAVEAEASGGLFARLAAKIGVQGGLIRGALAFIGRSFLKLLPVVGWLITAWDLGELVLNLELGGHKIADWALSLADKVGNAFERMWIRTKQFFGLLSNAAADAQVEAANRSSAARQASLGFGMQGGGGKFSGHGTSGSWGDAPPKSEADSIRDKMVRDAANVKLGPHVDTDGKHKGPKYNADAEQAKQDFKLAEYDFKTHLDVVKGIYDQGMMDAAAYYGHKQQIEDAAFETEIRELRKQEAALSAAGERKQAKEVQTEILLKQREQARNRMLNDQARVAAQDKEETDAINKKVAAIKAEIAAVQARNDDYKLQEDRIDNQREAGAITQDEAQRQILDLRRQEGQEDIKSAAAIRQMIVDLQAEKLLHADKADLIDKETAALTHQVAQMDIAGHKLALTQSQDFINVKNVAQSGFEGFFASLMKGGQSAKQMFKNLLTSILDGMEQIIAKKLAMQAVDAMSGGSGGGSGGGFIGMIAQFIGGSFAVGTDYVPHDMIAQIHKGEMIIPAAQAEAYRNGSTGNFSQHNTFVIPAPTDRRTQSQIASTVYAAGQKAASRNL